MGCSHYNTRFKIKNRNFVASANVSFVISTDTYKISNVYWNKVEDSHRTID